MLACYQYADFISPKSQESSGISKTTPIANDSFIRVSIYVSFYFHTNTLGKLRFLIHIAKFLGNHFYGAVNAGKLLASKERGGNEVRKEEMNHSSFLDNPLSDGALLAVVIDTYLI